MFSSAQVGRVSYLMYLSSFIKRLYQKIYISGPKGLMVIILVTTALPLPVVLLLLFRLHYHHQNTIFCMYIKSLHWHLKIGQWLPCPSTRVLSLYPDPLDTAWFCPDHPSGHQWFKSPSCSLSSTHRHLSSGVPHLFLASSGRL